MHKIALESRYSLHQKVMLFGFSFIAFTGFFNLISENLNMLGYLIAFLFFTLSIYFLALAFSKKGLLKRGQKLYKTSSFLGFIIFRRKISIIERPIVSILKFKKKQKFAFVSSANPDQSETFNSFEIFVLNQRHTKRDSVIYFKKKENADKAIDFLTTNFPLKHEIFSPDFS